jgi:mRNA interferase MazF
MVTPYVPEADDIVWLQFDPKARREQARDRAAMVVSPASYNRSRGMMICCPMTSRIKGYPFEIVVSQQPPSVVLSDQIRSLEWQARQASFKGRVSAAVLVEAQAKIKALSGP